MVGHYLLCQNLSSNSHKYYIKETFCRFKASCMAMNKIPQENKKKTHLHIGTKSFIFIGSSVIKTLFCMKARPITTVQKEI